jgi:dynein heavy chain
VRAIKQRVSLWEKDLNTISDVLDLWMAVQRKWMYLESIFGNDDIKQQLPEEAKKFGKTDKAYTAIMAHTHSNPLVRVACVEADGGKRFDDIKNISNDLDKCQKSLSNYL